MSINSLDVAIQEDAQIWFNLLDELRIIGIGADFGIPQIAVIGDQSSGKSSLLEALTGISFPRGVGLTTRCPTSIRLHKNSDADCEWAAAISLTSEKYHDICKELLGVVKSPEELATRVAALMDRLTEGSNRWFSSEVIHIRVEAAGVSDLIIVDLPGIIRTTTVGQSRDVITEVDKLLEEFIQQPNTIILAVIPANQDISTIDVLERAAQVDPMGSRTIGVLTKVDLVDQGAESETLAIVNNTRKPLALGYSMVKNRNQAQLRDGMRLETALREEENYFASHHIWKDVSLNNKGIRALSKKLGAILVRRAQDALPSLKGQLLKALAGAEAELHGLGEEVSADEFERRRMCLSIVSKFGHSFRQVTDLPTNNCCMPVVLTRSP